MLVELPFAPSVVPQVIPASRSAASSGFHSTPIVLMSASCLPSAVVSSMLWLTNFAMPPLVVWSERTPLRSSVPVRPEFGALPLTSAVMSALLSSSVIVIGVTAQLGFALGETTCVHSTEATSVLVTAPLLPVVVVKLRRLARSASRTGVHATPRSTKLPRSSPSIVETEPDSLTDFAEPPCEVVSVMRAMCEPTPAVIGASFDGAFAFERTSARTVELSAPAAEISAALVPLPSEEDVDAQP